MKGDERSVKKLRFFAGKFTEKLGAEPAVAVNIPKVTMLGANELQVENHKGIIEYSRENIRVNTDYGVVFVEGRDLYLNVMDADRVVISGIIHHIMTLDGGKKC